MKKKSSANIKALFKPRKPDSHKGNHGHALLVAGNKGMMGAAVIAAKACLRSGTGLLTVNLPEEERGIMQVAVPEAMLMMRETKLDNLDRFSSIGFGPGLGTDKQAITLLKHVLKFTSQPLIVDADGLNILSMRPALLNSLPANSIITPHPKEFDRLFGEHANASLRIKTAVQKAMAHNIIIVLKGHQTLITDGKQSFQNSTGNAGLAKGGSGDALTGIITALLAQNYSSLNAAILGVYLHGLAADIALQEQSMESMLATDAIECLGKAFRTLYK